MLSLNEKTSNMHSHDSLLHIIEANQRWSDQVQEHNPVLFKELDAGQSPEILWIGCSDSRVSPNIITGLGLGEVFVHRNIGNTILSTDLNLLAVLQYAIEQLKVKHIVCCGHYKCGAVQAGMSDGSNGILDQWLSQIKSLYNDNKKDLAKLEYGEQFDRMCELNALANYENICNSFIIKKAVEQGQKLSIHCWCFRLSDGRLVRLAETNF